MTFVPQPPLLVSSLGVKEGFLQKPKLVEIKLPSCLQEKLTSEKNYKHICFYLAGNIFPINTFLVSAETKYFVCSCPRCADPTELGTMFSSIRCPQCTAENGYLVPTVPGHCELVDTAMADWRCVTCAKTQTAKFVNAVTQVMGLRNSCCQ